MNNKTDHKKFGTIAIIGKPNVGKSTLLNHLLGKKVSITSRKPQTTRHRILGIKTTEESQVVYVDTPGLHTDQKHQMNRMMNRAAKSAFGSVDGVLFLVDALQWDAQDDAVLRLLSSVEAPVIAVINKIDKIKNKALLLPFIETLSKRFSFKKILPISAKTELQIPALMMEIEQMLPHTGFCYPAEQITLANDQFICTEFVREKLMRALGDEVPYELTVTLEAFEKTAKIVRVAAVIWVAKEGQKAIVIGKQGSVLKKIGTRARESLEEYFSKKVLLKLWVRVKENWSDDIRALQSFGYTE